jgi:molybdopterin synthase sulfur carrier subunit
MAKAFIKMPIGLVGTEGPPELACEGTTLRDALEDCVAKEPRLRKRIFREDGGVWVGIFVNGRNMRQLGGLDTELADGDVIKMIPPIAGG